MVGVPHRPLLPSLPTEALPMVRHRLVSRVAGITEVNRGYRGYRSYMGLQGYRVVTGVQCYMGHRG